MPLLVTEILFNAKRSEAKTFKLIMSEMLRHYKSTAKNTCDTAICIADIITHAASGISEGVIDALTLSVSFEIR